MSQPEEPGGEDRGPSADRRVAAILDITEVLCGKTEYTEVVAAALEASLEVVDADSGSILLHNPDEDTLVFEYVLGPTGHQLLGRSMPSSAGIAGRVFHSGVASLTHDVPHEQDHYRRIPDELGYAAQTMITVPLRAHGGRTLGVLQAINKRHGAFAQGDLELLTIVATQAGTIIENARLHEAARLGAVARLLARVGHDVKNMISSVVASARALEAIVNKHFDYVAAATGDCDHEAAGAIAGNATDSREKCGEVLERLVRAAARLSERTEQMADCIRGNLSPPAMALTDIAEVAGDVVNVLKPVAEQRGVNLVLERDGGHAGAMADGSRIFNALYNLVINAIPATPDGGRVTVRVEGVAGSADGDGSITVKVMDTGSGIPPDLLETLFTSEITTKAAGTGLGTRIVKEVADIHSGTVTAESQIGKGSCFTLTLPVTPPDDAEGQP